MSAERTRMKLAARVRRFYWKRLRRYDAEICGRPDHPHEQIRRGCGRPVGVVWRAESAVWNYVVTGQDQTVYTVREGAAGGPIMERAEGAGGVLCLHCFDQLARERGVHLYWEAGHGFHG
jgi:hypothetical protein